MIIPGRARGLLLLKSSNLLTNLGRHFYLIVSFWIALMAYQVSLKIRVMIGILARRILYTTHGETKNYRKKTRSK